MRCAEIHLKKYTLKLPYSCEVAQVSLFLRTRHPVCSECSWLRGWVREVKPLSCFILIYFRTETHLSFISQEYNCPLFSVPICPKKIKKRLPKLSYVHERFSVLDILQLQFFSGDWDIQSSAFVNFLYVFNESCVKSKV